MAKRGNYIRTKEHRTHQSELASLRPRKPHSEKTKKKMSIAKLGIKKSIEHRQHISKARVGMKMSESSNVKKSIAAKNRMLNNKGIGCFASKKSGYEKQIENILKEKNFNFKYVGDGKFHIQSSGEVFNPDFIHCNKNNKLAIEVYGKHFKQLNYGSESNYLRERFNLYHDINWDVIFFNDEDLKDKETIKNRIKQFVEFYN